ncbi:MAG TPA: hypothetical protein VFF17_00685, partial [Thermoanaerobaculia bacterium]|nr:hypothetical protein [Thermoanaerobaculia bacterium]
MGRSIRFLAAAAALAAVAGCNRDDDDDDDPIPPPPGAAVIFREDFSGSFPGSQWDIVSGDPFTSGAEGNHPPSLILNPVDESIVIRGDFVYSSEEAFTLSFETASFEVQADSEFRFLLVAAGSGSVDASFQTLPFDDEVFVSIL